MEDSKLNVLQAYPHQASLARLVYMDLVLAKMWKTVDIVPTPSLQACLMVAHEPGTPSQERLVIVPVLHETNLSVHWMSTLFSGLEKDGLRNDSKVLNKITLAIISSDSTIVYYHLSKGLEPPHGLEND